MPRLVAGDFAGIATAASIAFLPGRDLDIRQLLGIGADFRCVQKRRRRRWRRRRFWFAFGPAIVVIQGIVRNVVPLERGFKAAVACRRAWAIATAGE